MEAIIILFFFLFFIVVFATIILLFVEMFFIFMTRVPYAGTPATTIERILDEIKIESGQIVYDLGCGDGRFLFAAEKRGGKAVGFELSPFAFLRAWFTKITHKSRAHLHYASFYRAHLFDADVVYCFLVRGVMYRIEKKLLEELKPGTTVVSYGFPFPNWHVQKIIQPQPGDHFSSQVYIYKR